MNALAGVIGFLRNNTCIDSDNYPVALYPFFYLNDHCDSAVLIFIFKYNLYNSFPFYMSLKQS